MKRELKPLRDLNEGDYFYSKSDKNLVHRYKVMGSPEFNLRAGSATRKCLHLGKKEIEDKLCRIEVLHIPQ